MAETNGNEPHRNEPALLNIEDDMRQSYLDYAMSVNIGRALPQIRDGLKPVSRSASATCSSTGREISVLLTAIRPPLIDTPNVS